MAYPLRRRGDRPRPGGTAQPGTARTALVTGASRGLGLLIARELAARGRR